MSSGYSEAVDRNDANVGEMEDGCGTRNGKRMYRRDISSRPKDRRDKLKFNTKDYHRISGGSDDTRLNEYTLGEGSNYEQTQNTIKTNNSHLDNNLNKHRGIKSFTCDICKAKFTLKDSLKAHIKNKHTDTGSAKDYKCLECSYQTNDKRNLQAHLNKHRCIKAFKCDICIMKFTFKGNLAKHIKNKHRDDGSTKDYKCSECSYATNYKSHLHRHRNKHRVIKSFTCDICMMTFTEKYYLKMHIKNKHTDDESTKSYKCLECSFQTNYKRDLQRHLNRHKGIKQFQCDICMVRFTRKDSLNTHVKRKHTSDKSVKD